MSVLGSNVLAGASGQAAEFQIERSLRFNSADSAYLSRTPSSASNRDTFTFSAWVKKSVTGNVVSLIGVGTDSSNLDAIDYQDECIRYTRSTGGTFKTLKTNAVFRDLAWYHVVVAVDTTQSTSSDRVKIYVNGVEQTSFSSSTYPDQNEDTFFNSTNAHTIGRRNASQSDYFDGNLAEIHFLDGTAVSDATDFGEYDDYGVWQAKQYSGSSYGTNGFYLPFSDATSTTTIAEDSSGNSNDFTANNISVTAGTGNDSLFDSPTNGSQSDGGNGGEVSGNYATLNPLDSPLNNFGTPSNGNLDFQGSSDAYHTLRATISIPSTGKWYYESTFNGTAFSPRASNSQFSGVGFVKTNVEIASITDGNSNWLGDSGYGLNFSGTRTEFHNAAIDSGDVVGVAINRDANTFEYFVNGTSVETGTIGVASGTDLSPFVYVYGSSYTTHVLNFGQRAFAHSAPSGYKALCTTNLPTPTIPDGSTAFDAATWTGDHDTSGGSNASRTISLPGNLNADLVWIKRRSTSFNHLLNDSVRGFAVNKGLSSNTTDSESNTSSDFTYGFVSGTADGEFTIQSGIVDSYANKLNETHVAWVWDAGSSTVSNTDGGITSSVRANTSAGFSIVSYTGSGSNTTVGHGLNAAPSMVIVKRRDDANNWRVGHDGLTDWSYRINLESSGAQAQQANVWNSTAPTSSVFSIGTSSSVNYNTGTYIAYCWSEVSGFSRFGSYTGNGSSDGTFVYTGFRPAFLLIKRSDSSTSWYIFDSARSTFNVVDDRIQAHSSNAENTNSAWSNDFLSNGFKLRTTEAELNNDGSSYIYAAFSENAFSLNGGLAR